MGLCHMLRTEYLSTPHEALLVHLKNAAGCPSHILRAPPRELLISHSPFRASRERPFPGTS